MKISVIGCGYLGAVHAAAMASLGHEVLGVDVDTEKVATLQAGLSPFFEPGLPELLLENVEANRLSFTDDIAMSAGCKVHFIAVGTPQVKGGVAADMTFVDAAVSGLLPHLNPGDLVVGKSTVPVGTAARLASLVESVGADLLWNPEFLREGYAVLDTLTPDRLVYGVGRGTSSGQESTAGTAYAEAMPSVALLDEVYARALAAGVPRLVTDFATAELVKVAANAFLATKISFINAMAEIAEVSGADIVELADAIGYDERIGRKFLNAGIGFGGGCLPKDIRAFSARAEELGRGQSVAFLKEVDAINTRRRERVVDLVVEALGGSVFNRKIAVLGLAFKPNSDDVRDSPALDVAVRLHGLGAQVVASDPQAVANARLRHPQLDFATAEEALKGAEAVLLLTEWSEYRSMDPNQVGDGVAQRIIVDGRNCLPKDDWRAAGWHYIGLGRH